MSLVIVPFIPEYALKFKELNVAWLQKYFYVEPKDSELLEGCKESIIDKGGHIFFAQYDEEIVGCFSLIKINDTHFELGKMAVEPKFQGLRIGQQLIQFAIDFANENQWHKITLYSSTKLPHALYLYRKYGFTEIELEKDLPYARSDIKMELKLKNHE